MRPLKLGGMGIEGTEEAGGRKEEAGGREEVGGRKEEAVEGKGRRMKRTEEVGKRIRWG